MRRSIGPSFALLALALALPPALAHAGTQDFTLVNKTGFQINNLYISETSNDNWEEDVLGDRILPEGGRIEIEFHGKSACLWDMMVRDQAGESVTWNGLNLCEASVIILKCDDEKCWAEWE